MRFHSTALAFSFALGALLVAPRCGSAFVPPWAIDPESTENDARAVSTVLPPEDDSQAANRDQFDVLHYEIFLAPDFDTESLTAAVTVTLQAEQDGVVFVDLDLANTLEVDRVTGSGTALPFDHTDDVLRLFPPQPLDRDDTWTATIHYGGQPEPTGFLGFSFGTTPAGNPLLATLSQPYGARSWWPCKDTPDDKATVLLRAVVPDGLYVASNGILEVEVPSGGNTLFQWRHEYPISTYGVSIAVAEYVSWEETWLSPGGRVLPIEYHVFPEHEEAARFDFGRTTEILDYYTELFGEYPFVDEKYGMAEFVWEGAMEHQTMTSYGDVFLTGDRFYERIIGHELAHQWWGNSMTLEDWGELWVHEGFATLAEGLWVERAEGTAAYRTFLRRRSNGCCGFNGPISPPNRLFNQTVFNKAAWMLHMLRGFLGDTAFFSAMYDLAQRPELQYGTIVTEDVVEQFETSTGQPLQWFFDQWLYRIGRPTFTVDWTTKSVGDRTRLQVVIDQSDLAEPWIFPLRLRAVTPSGPVDLETFVASDTHQYTAFVDGDVEDVLVDPDEWLLKFVVETATDAPAPAGPAARLLPNAPNPFNPRTALRFELPTPQDVRLRILDARGRVVDVLEPGPMPAGRHRMPWTGVDRRGNPVASGTYRVLLEADGTVSSVRPITLVR
jgi:aminopeptidase N